MHERVHKPSKSTQHCSSAPVRNPLQRRSFGLEEESEQQETSGVWMSDENLKRLSAMRAANFSVYDPRIATPAPVQTKSLVQREEMPEEEKKAVQAKSLVQREETLEKKEKELQAKSAVDASIPKLQANFERSLNRAKRGGSPLDRAFRAKVEPAMGADFSGVKVHTDSEADRLSQSIQAKAFTTGEDIFFKKGEYKPGSQKGQELLAHELTNVIQENYHQPQSQIVQQVSNQEIINAFFDDIWDKITETKTDIWNAFTNVKSNTVNSGGDNNQTSDVVELQVPNGEFTVTDAKAIIRRPPPDLTSESGKPLIAKGSQVLILEGVRKGSKDYVRVRETMPSEFQGPLQNSGWTAASNIGGLSQTLLTLNPATKKPEVVVPKPNSQGILGLPDKPSVEHSEFTSIVQEIEKMEQNPLGVEKKHGEETGDERTKRVEKIGQLRQIIATLGEKIPELEANQIQEAQGYLYRRLAPLTPYFGQMANTNILQGTEKSNKGWKRTCNVTVPAMVIEGLGKTKDNYDQSKVPLLKKIFNALEGKYKERKKYDAATDFNALRLPDFMALVGIARLMPEGSESLADDQFINVVSEKRKEAAKKTTHHKTMMYLIEQFGCSHKKYRVNTSELDKIGTAQKAYTKVVLRGKNPEEWRELYNQVESGEKSFNELSKKEQKRYQTLWKYEQFNKEQADTLLPVNNYRKAVLKKVNPLLDQGAQILVGMENHFVRLDMLDQNTIQVDDPGEKGFKNLQVSWEQSRNLGYFKGFWAIKS
ncbi:MAG: DUF4157 domain-containing protein [Moorea sp. SIO2B7]|nr:DUF4157 domain-containing protein [Moorena sp. SIO2B7]